MNEQNDTTYNDDNGELELNTRIEETFVEIQYATQEIQRLNSFSSTQPPSSSALQQDSQNIICFSNEQDPSPLSMQEFYSQQQNSLLSPSQQPDRKPTSTPYEHRRAARKLDRYLDTLTSLLYQYETTTTTIISTNESQSIELNSEMMEQLIQVLTTVSGIQNHSSHITDSKAMMLNHNSTSTHGNVLQDANKSLYKACTEKTSRLVHKYGSFPLSEQHFDILIDHLANIVSSLSSRTFLKNLDGMVLEPLLSIMNASLAHSSSNILLTQKETIHLLKILIPNALNDLSSCRWYPSWNEIVSTVTNCSDGTTGKQFPRHGPNNRKGVHYTFHIRVLITFLLAHLQQQLHKDESNRENNQDESENESNNESVIPPRFMSVLQEYVSEMMEYALDALEGAGAHYSRQVTSFNSTNIRKNKGSSQEAQSHTSTLSSSSTLLHSSRIILHEALFHATLAVRTFEILKKSHPHILIQSPSNSLMILFRAFTTFVATYSKELEEFKRSPQLIQEIQYNNVFFMISSFTSISDLATVLVRLSSSGNSDTTELFIQDEHHVESCIITLLMALGASCQPCSETSINFQNAEKNENKRGMEFLLQKCLSFQTSSSRLPNVGDEHLTHLLQLAAVSSMSSISPQWRNAQESDQLQDVCDALLKQSSNDESSPNINESTMNPWHSLVARKLRENNFFTDDASEPQPGYKDSISKYCQAVQPYMNISEN